MEQFGQAKSEIQNKFEGGVSFNINWYDLAGQARREMMKKINPRGAKRRVPVYGGISADLPVYSCPDDVNVPAEFYPDAQTFSGRGYKYRAAKAFYQSLEQGDRVFTIDHINGQPFILARSDNGTNATIVSAIDSSAFTGTVSLTTTQRTFLSGTGAVFGTFDDTNYEAVYSYTDAQDYSAYALGVVVVPFYIADASKVDYIELRLRTSAGNYYSVKTTIAGINNYYFDNWCLARLDMSKKTIEGAPDLANVNSIVVHVKMKTGESQEVTLDDIKLYATQSATFEYYSSKIFKGADGTFKAKPDNESDTIVLEEEEYDIWFYEMCNLVVQDATYDSIDSKESDRFARKLKESYDAYHMRFPSMEEPISYNISSDVDLNHYDNQGL